MLVCPQRRQRRYQGTESACDGLFLDEVRLAATRLAPLRARVTSALCLRNARRDGFWNVFRVSIICARSIDSNASLSRSLAGREARGTRRRGRPGYPLNSRTALPPAAM